MHTFKQKHQNESNFKEKFYALIQNYEPKIDKNFEIMSSKEKKTFLISNDIFKLFHKIAIIYF